LLRRTLSRTVRLLALLALPAAAQSTPPPTLHLQVLLSDLEPLHERQQRQAELFYAALKAEWSSKDRWGARAELRGTEGRFRDYFRGSLWLEEGYGFAPTPLGELRVGKLPRVFGVPDETFGGDLHSRNGVTRNPEFGVSLSGSREFGLNSLTYTLSYLGANDHVAFEEDGRGVESDPLAKLRDGLELRAGYRLYKGLVTITPAVSAATAHIVRSDGLPSFWRTDLGADLTATIGPISAAVGLLTRNGEEARAANRLARLGYDDAFAGILNLKVEFPTLVVRYVYSTWRYAGADLRESLHQPAVVWLPRKGIEATIEYEGRRLSGPGGVESFSAFRFGLGLSY